jgi:hypothetical protein
MNNVIKLTTSDPLPNYVEVNGVEYSRGGSFILAKEAIDRWVAPDMLGRAMEWLWYPDAEREE